MKHKYYDEKGIVIYNGDCLEKHEKIKDSSVDLILTDLPYGNMKRSSACKAHSKLFGKIDDWDNQIKPERIYEIADRILRKNGKMVLFAQEPYTHKLITGTIPNVKFNYKAIWEKDSFANVLATNQNMVGFYEDILIFSKMECYVAENPLRKTMKRYANKYGKGYLYDLLRKEGRYTTDLSARVHTDYKFGCGNGRRFDFIGKSMYDYLSDYINFDETFDYMNKINERFKTKYAGTFNLWEGNKYKSNILKYKKDHDGYHPTQKPVLLLDDLIKTFSNENELVVDLTMGSGSTMISCKNTGRRGIGIELGKEYFNIAKRRIIEYENQLNLF